MKVGKKMEVIVEFKDGSSARMDFLDFMVISKANYRLVLRSLCSALREDPLVPVMRVAARAGVNPSNFWGYVYRLKARGFLTESHGHVAFTEKGEKACDLIRAMEEKGLEHVLASSPP